jgi:hypothetical protein
MIQLPANAWIDQLGTKSSTHEHLRRVGEPFISKEEDFIKTSKA